jgi:hypothetical protein
MAFALSLTPAIAWAEPTDTDRATARILALEGQKAYNSQDFTTAAERFARADSLIHAPTLSLALARSQAALGKLVTAQEIYNRVVREGAPAGSPPSWSKAVDDAKREAAMLAPRIPSLTITVSGAVDAKVTIDGVLVPAAALGVRRPVDPGKHVIRAEATGFAAAEANLTLAEGKNAPVVLKLEPASAKAPAPLAAATPPAETPKASPEITPPAEAQPDTDAPKGSPRKTIGMVALGVGGAGLLLGAVTGGLAIGKHGALKTACGEGPCPASQQNAVDSYHLLGALSTAGFIAGGACAATGVILLLTAPRAEPTKAATLTPVLGLGYLGAEGKF